MGSCRTTSNVCRDNCHCFGIVCASWGLLCRKKNTMIMSSANNLGDHVLLISHEPIFRWVILTFGEAFYFACHCTHVVVCKQPSYNKSLDFMFQRKMQVQNCCHPLSTTPNQIRATKKIETLKVHDHFGNLKKHTKYVGNLIELMFLITDFPIFLNLSLSKPVIPRDKTAWVHRCLDRVTWSKSGMAAIEATKLHQITLSLAKWGGIMLHAHVTFVA